MSDMQSDKELYRGQDVSVKGFATIDNVVLINVEVRMIDKVALINVEIRMIDFDKATPDRREEHGLVTQSLNLSPLREQGWWASRELHQQSSPPCAMPTSMSL